MSLIEGIHGSYVHDRRTRVLSRHLAKLLRPYEEVLDVGCGDGLLAHLIGGECPRLQLKGIDPVVRSSTHIRVQWFDGDIIPYEDDSFDALLFVDVLHHTEDPAILLREAVRVARQAIVIKDHTLQGWLAGPCLRFMDRVGNVRHSVALPYNYWSYAKWMETFESLHLRVGSWEKDLALYPPPADWIFGRSLHFLARVDLER